MKHFTAISACVTVLFLSGAVLAKPDKPEPTDPIFPPGGTKRVSDWIKELRTSDDLKTRQKALVAMKVVGPKVPGVVVAVCGTMKQDKDVGMRIDAAQTLGQFAPPLGKSEPLIDTAEMVDSLQTVLAGDNKDAEERVREAAAASLGKMGTQVDKQSQAQAALLAALKDKPSVQAAAAASIDVLVTPNEGVGYLGCGILALDAGEPMLALLKDAGAPMQARCSAARLVSKLKSLDGRISALTDVLADDKNDPQLRRTVADMLGRFRELAIDAVPALGKALNDKNVDLRIDSGTALAQIANTPQGRRKVVEVLPEIRKALKDQDATVRNRAIDILARLESDGADAVKDLIACLKSESVIENRVAAIRVFGLIGPPAKEALDLLNGYKTSANPDVRKAAGEAIKKIEGS
jgi:HEAT repeat protein